MIIDESYKKYLLERYEDTYYPQNAIDAGKAAYIMIVVSRNAQKRSDKPL